MSTSHFCGARAARLLKTGKISWPAILTAIAPRCASAALAAVIVGGGVKAAYCNDAFLVIVSDGTPGFPTYLTSIKNPPGAVGSDGSACVTRTVNPSYQTYKIPLNPTLLSTGDKPITIVQLIDMDSAIKIIHYL